MDKDEIDRDETIMNGVPLLNIPIHPEDLLSTKQWWFTRGMILKQTKSESRANAPFKTKLLK
jgi:hypothetical protein